MTLRRGYTLMEMVVYMGLFAVTGLLLATIFTVSKRAQQSTTASYVVSGQTDTAMRFLRQDLQETVLTSVYANTVPFPYVSMCSARDMQTDPRVPGKLLISEYGVPRWRKHVYYGLRPASGQTGSLVRWEVALTNDTRLPQVAPAPTTASAIPGDARPILRNVLQPNQTVQGLPGFTPPGAWGGFRAQFVRRSGGEPGVETMANLGPSYNQAQAQDNTRLVEIEMQILENEMKVAGTNFYTLRMRVCPQY